MDNEIVLEVTQEDIDQGIPGQGDSCAIARCVKPITIKLRCEDGKAV